MNEISSFENHIVILGWSRRVERIIRELRNEVHRSSNDLRPILIVVPTPRADIQSRFERVYFVYGHINDPEVLARAQIARAHTVLIPSLPIEDRSLDGEAVFSMLAALSVNSKARLCVELANAENSEILEKIRKDVLTNPGIEIVSFETVAEFLLAQASVNPGITRVYSHLLSFSEDTNELYVAELPSTWAQQSFQSLAHHCFDRGVIVFGFERDGQLQVNPTKRDVTLQPEDKIWFMALSKSDGMRAMATGSRE
ncbi:MAG: NAD-binding protein [Bdellovibrionales bacterium]|nr:NAD-binding protein [Bdellovibrionales bacterium]